VHVELLVKNEVLYEKFNAPWKLIPGALYGKWAVPIQEEAEKAFGLGTLYGKLALLM